MKVLQPYSGCYTARQANDNDLLVLPSSSIIGQVNMDAVAMLMSLGLPQENAGQLSVNGVTFPLEDKWVLLPAEQQEVQQATAAFNQAIKSIADANDLAFVDVNAILNQVAATGVTFDEFSLNARLVFGGAFSLDGVHPTARGKAYLANKFLEAINAKFGSNIPPVKAAAYRTVYPENM